MKRRIAVIACAAALAACDMSLWEPEVGPPMQEFCVNEDSDESTDVSYSADIVPQIFDDEAESAFGCNKCHLPDGETAIGVQVGGLDISSYSTLRAGGLVSGAQVIVPGRPCESLLFQKVSPGVPFGARMPFDGPPYLSDVALGLLHDWIAEGARDN